MIGDVDVIFPYISIHLSIRFSECSMYLLVEEGYCAERSGEWLENGKRRDDLVQH